MAKQQSKSTSTGTPNESRVTVPRTRAPRAARRKPAPLAAEAIAEFAPVPAILPELEPIYIPEPAPKAAKVAEIEVEPAPAIAVPVTPIEDRTRAPWFDPHGKTIKDIIARVRQELTARIGKFAPLLGRIPWIGKRFL
jgi:hypothetical protein